jgi:xylulokinase
MPSLVLGIDVGSTSTKVLLAEPSGAVLAQASAPVELSSPHPGWAEADPRQWWRNVCALVPRVLGTRAGDLAAVACTGMVPAVVLIDGARPLRPAILQNDARATSQITSLAQELADLDLVTATGSALTQQSVAPTLAWLAANAPQVRAQATHVLGSYDWLAVALGAAPHVERNWALESGLYSLAAQPGQQSTLMDRVLTAAGIPAGLLPPVAAPGTVIGEVSAAAAAQAGLRAGTPIVTGGADPCSPCSPTRSRRSAASASGCGCRWARACC